MILMMIRIVVDVCTKTKYIGPKLFDAKLCEFIGNEKLQQMIMMPKITPRLVHPAVDVNQGGNVQPGNPGDSGTSSDEQPLLFQKYSFTMITTNLHKEQGLVPPLLRKAHCMMHRHWKESR